MAAYGSGMLLNTDTSSSKVGESCFLAEHSESQGVAHLIHLSHPSLRMSLSQYWHVETSWTERDGFGCLLLSREGLHHILHKQ